MMSNVRNIEISPSLGKLEELINREEYQNFQNDVETADRVTKWAMIYLSDRKLFDKIVTTDNKILVFLLLKAKDELAHFMHPYKYEKSTRRLAAHYIDILTGDTTDADKQMINLAMLEFVKYGCLDGVKQMMDLGADIHFLADAPLSNAIEEKHVNIIEYIVKNFEGFSNNYKQWIRIKAIQSNNLEIVKLIIGKLGVGDDLQIHTEKLEIIDYLRSSKRHRISDEADDE